MNALAELIEGLSWVWLIHWLAAHVLGATLMAVGGGALIVLLWKHKDPGSAFTLRGLFGLVCAVACLLLIAGGLFLVIWQSLGNDPAQVGGSLPGLREPAGMKPGPRLPAPFIDHGG